MYFGYQEQTICLENLLTFKKKGREKKKRKKRKKEKERRNKTDYTVESFQLQVAEREVFQERFGTGEVKGQGTIHGVTVTDTRRYDEQVKEESYRIH